MRPVRWGILATGDIAATFAADLRRTPGAELAAVGSRRLASAQTFAARLGVARARRLFFMEAMWMRCNPNIVAMQRLVASGAIGAVSAVGRRLRLPVRQAA